MEAFLRRALHVKTVKSTGMRGGGCINEGTAFEIDDGRRIFVKMNVKAMV